MSFCCTEERTTDVPTTPVGLPVAIPAFREMVIASFVRLWAEFRVTSHNRCIFSTPFTQVLACDPQQIVARAFGALGKPPHEHGIALCRSPFSARLIHQVSGCKWGTVIAALGFGLSGRWCRRRVACLFHDEGNKIRTYFVLYCG